LKTYLLTYLLFLFAFTTLGQTPIIITSDIDNFWDAFDRSHNAKSKKELSDEFRKEMFGKDYSKWLYNGFSSKERPADLGYFIGYRICEAFYDQAEDKEEALNTILK
jgi:uncharacterized protein YjaZ